MKAAHVKIFMLLILLALAASATLACGDSRTAGETQDDAGAGAIQTESSSAPVDSNPVTLPAAEGAAPVMPNVDPGEAAAASEAAILGFSQQRGGNGAEPVWGPNIVEGWAFMGMADAEGNDYQEMLLHREGSGWVVRDIGQSLAQKWKNQTPPGLWP